MPEFVQARQRIVTAELVHVENPRGIALQAFDLHFVARPENKDIPGFFERFDLFERGVVSFVARFDGMKIGRITAIDEIKKMK